jgi:hypothetical protein
MAGVTAATLLATVRWLLRGRVAAPVGAPRDAAVDPAPAG